MNLRPSSSAVCLEYSPRDTHILVGGCYNGQIAVWDTRKHETPVLESEISQSHCDVAWRVKWILSKTGTEIFSAGADGQVLWWDTRKLNEPLDVLILNPNDSQNITFAQGAYCLEYDTSLPTKFMVGTDQGKVLSCLRKIKSIDEKISQVYDADNGPIHAIQRNPFFLDKFLTVSDWRLRIWSEKVKEWAIFSTRYSDTKYTDGCWSPVRPSVFMVSKYDGSIEIWDLVFNISRPAITAKLTDKPLQCIRVDHSGQYMTLGANDGSVHFLELPKGLYTQMKGEKALLGSMFERESRREKILESRSRELKMKQKMKVQENADVPVLASEYAHIRKETLENAEEAFFAYLNEKRDLFLQKRKEEKFLSKSESGLMYTSSACFPTTVSGDAASSIRDDHGDDTAILSDKINSPTQVDVVGKCSKCCK